MFEKLKKLKDLKIKKTNGTDFSYNTLAYTMGEVGLIIALPLVFFVLIGIKIDQIFKTTPLFIIVSMFFAIFLSTMALKKKIKGLNNTNKV